ncbi:hypothetical protein BpHYR1_012961 [Brachionus plicatilis]|uniref:Chromo domain-containing protein n=1 Tax=Brachionus plicatilis TaxID=10195 RepID=A0A3M7RC23_BRAPC|nr:hypothetical protein BpHYR1_012961 [Brachionus plicatilis]
MFRCESFLRNDSNSVLLFFWHVEVYDQMIKCSIKNPTKDLSTPLKQEGNSIANTKINTKSPTVNMGRKIPSTLEKPLKSRLGEDTQSGETSESESEMVEGRTISTLTTTTDETVTAPDATTSSEATARQINVPGCSNHNDIVDEELEKEEEDFTSPEEILKRQLMSEFKRNSKFDLRDIEYFINGIIGHKFEEGKLKLLLKWDKVGKKEYQDSWEAFSDVYAPTLYKNYSKKNKIKFCKKFKRCRVKRATDGTNHFKLATDLTKEQLGLADKTFETIGKGPITKKRRKN